MMVESARMELGALYGMVDPALDRQHTLAIHKAYQKWVYQQSRLKKEAAERFWIRAKGCAALVSAFGGGSVVGAVVTLLIEHRLLA